jgi:hypothetical protein
MPISLTSRVTPRGPASFGSPETTTGSSHRCRGRARLCWYADMHTSPESRGLDETALTGNLSKPSRCEQCLGRYIQVSTRTGAFPRPLMASLLWRGYQQEYPQRVRKSRTEMLMAFTWVSHPSRSGKGRPHLSKLHSWGSGAHMQINQSDGQQFQSLSHGAFP